jgi:predicted DNA binding CopG/RHH family protein
MTKLKLDAEEQAILEAFEKGEFRSVLSPARRKQVKRIAAQTVKKDKRINIRIASRVLDGLQRRALEEGVPYQTLVASVLHKYVSGGLKDVTAGKHRSTWK